MFKILINFDVEFCESMGERLEKTSSEKRKQSLLRARAARRRRNPASPSGGPGLLQCQGRSPFSRGVAVRTAKGRSQICPEVRLFSKKPFWAGAEASESLTLRPITLTDLGCLWGDCTAPPPSTWGNSVPRPSLRLQVSGWGSSPAEASAVRRSQPELVTSRGSPSLPPPNPRCLPSP